VTCVFTGGYAVFYAKYTTPAARDSYARFVRGGHNGKLKVDRDSFWTNAGARKGVYVAGSRENNTSQYIYWDSMTVPVSAELLVRSGDAKATETFWKNQL
jgi:hypothetical protein